MKNQLKAGAILSYISIFLNIIIGLLYTPFMILSLGKNEYGLYNTVSSTISMLGLLSLGFGSGYVKYFAKYKKEDNLDGINKLNGLFIIIFSTIGFVALCCGMFLSFNLNLVFDSGLTSEEYQTGKILMIILTLNLALFFPMSVFTTIINANEKFSVIKILSIVKTICSPLVTVPLLLFGYKSVAVVAVSVLVTIITELIEMFYVILVLKNKFVFHGFEKGLFKSIFLYISLIAVHMAVDQVNWNIDKILLGRFKGTEEVAIYSTGYLFCFYYTTFGLPISSVFTPRIHKIIARNDHTKNDSLTNLFIRVGRVQFAILILVCTGFIFFGKPFIYFWVGPGYEESYYVGLLLMIPTTIDLIQHVGIEIQRAENKHGFRAIVYSIMAVINLITSIFLCQLYGAIGSAIGTAISFIVVQGFIINIYYYKKCGLDVKKFWTNIIKSLIKLFPIFLVGICFFLLDITTFQELIVSIFVYSTIYCLYYYIFVCDENEKKLTMNIFKKAICIFNKKNKI